MSWELLQVIVLLLAAVVLFATGRVRMDVTALLLVVVFVLSGLLSLPEALVGFSDPNVILIAALFVVGEGLVRTGVAYSVGDWLLKAANQSETRMTTLLMLAVAGLGSVMSSTGVVAIFIPVALSIAHRMHIPPGRIMMPLSFAGLISGMMTLVATPPNLIASSELERHGLPGLEFFSVTPIGLLILGMSILYMRLVAPRFLSAKQDKQYDRQGRRKIQDLIRQYELAGRARRLQVKPGSPLIGKTLDELQLRARYGANVIGVERIHNFHRVFVGVSTLSEFKAGDVMLIDMAAPAEAVRYLCQIEGLLPLVLRGEYFSQHARTIGMAEVSLIPDSRLIGKSVREVEFRTHYGLNIVGVRRQGAPLTGNLTDELLQLSDTLLVIGDWKQIRQLQHYKQDFLLFDLPAEVDEMAPAHSQAPYALFCVGLMVVMMLSGWMPNVIAALITCLLLGLFRCVDMPSAYRSIQWPTLLLIVGVMPFATALQKSGGLSLIVDVMASGLAGFAPHVMLLVLFVVCAVIGLFISNTATALLMAPIAVALAREMAVSPYPLVVTVAIAASAAFMTPVSSPVNTLVLHPGGYRFGDFVRLGVPFTLLVMVLTVVVVPLLFPF